MRGKKKILPRNILGKKYLALHFYRKKISVLFPWAEKQLLHSLNLPTPPPPPPPSKIKWSAPKLQMTLERVQRHATRWILKTNVGEMPYEDRLTTLNQLPLVYDRELRDPVLVYKSIFGCIDLNIEQFVSFVQHSRVFALKIHPLF
jgi:hypothetical protein